MKRLLVIAACCLFALWTTEFTSQSEEQPLTTETLRVAARELLDEFDGFKDTLTFRECTYGCGSRNPAAAWNARRDALNKQMTPQLDVPPRLKLAFGDMWQMGKDYAKGRVTEANELRSEIEAALR